MKKYLYLILALSAAGAVISAMLLLQHYYPDSGPGSLFCGRGIVNPCLTLAQSSHSTLFGMPLAAFGLLWHLTALFILLIADYAGDRYYAQSLGLLLPLAGAAVAADLALGAVLITTRLFCTLCIATYVVNAAVLVALLLWFRHSSSREGFNLITTCREILAEGNPSPDRKAFLASFILFIFLLFFAVFSTSYVLRLKTERGRIPSDKINSVLQEFYGMPPRTISFPESGIVLGDPGAVLTITAFTDFLCSACHEFYRMEKYLLSKYRGRIRIVYYNYPLDSVCNPEMKRTLYRNSCVASRAFIAVSKAGILDRYLIAHFADYRRTHVNYSVETSLQALRKSGLTSHDAVDEKLFLSLMESEETANRLSRDIMLAKELGVEATPTLFIGGRKMEGVPPVEILDRIIGNELSRK